MDIIRRYKEQGVALPKSTVYDWAKEFMAAAPSHEPDHSGIAPDQDGRLRLPIDPESPIEQVIHKLWDLYNDADRGEDYRTINAKTRILEVVLKATQLQQSMAIAEEESAPSQGDVHVEIVAG